MTTARGDQATVVARVQNGFDGTEVAGDGKFVKLPFYSYNVVPSEDLGEDDEIHGDLNPGDAVAGLRNLSGDMVVPMRMNSFGWHLAQMLGDPVTTEIAAGTKYQHVFTTKKHPAMRFLTHGISHAGVDRHFVQDSLAYASLNLRAQKNGERGRATFNLIGREELKSASGLDATPVEYSPDPAPVGFQGKCQIDGSDEAAITEANLTLSRGIEPDQEGLNGLATAAGIDNGMWGLSGSIGVRFKDTVFYDRANSGTLIDLSLSWQINADHHVTFLMPKVRLERTGVPVGGRGNLSTTFNFKANRPATGAALLTATLRNAVAAYANPT
jgi:hypothetical protein